MREPEGDAGRDWLSDRSGGDVFGYTGGGGAAWTPVHDEPTPQPVNAWWTGLRFEEAGRVVPLNNNTWSARELSLRDPLYAGVARDYLATFKEAPDVNNWACASIYADPADAAKVRAVLEGLKEKSELIEGNLKLIREHTK